MLALQAAGKQVHALDKRPELLPGLEFYFQCYRDLDCDRGISMAGLGPIPWSSIIKWCQVYRINAVSGIQRMVRYVRAMESAEFSFREKRRPKK